MCNPVQSAWPYAATLGLLDAGTALERSSGMTQPSVSFRVVLLCVVSVLAGCTSVPSEGLAQSGTKSVGALTAKLPPNYRQLMANYIRDTWISNYPIRSGKISQPHARPAGLFSSSVVSAVCAVVFRDNPLGQTVTENYVMTIEDGRVGLLPNISVDSCPGYSTFHELRR
jgi:hypothetical protein